VGEEAEERLVVNSSDYEHAWGELILKANHLALPRMRRQYLQEGDCCQQSLNFSLLARGQNVHLPEGIQLQFQYRSHMGHEGDLSEDVVEL
jgi:hypothetical protein